MGKYPRQERSEIDCHMQYYAVSGPLCRAPSSSLALGDVGEDCLSRGRPWAHRASSTAAEVKQAAQGNAHSA